MAKPFHESIVGAIEFESTLDGMSTLARLIKATKIPGNHDEIMDAWVDLKRQLNVEDFKFGVELYVLAEKERVEKEAAPATAEVDEEAANESGT